MNLVYVISFPKCPHKRFIIGEGDSSLFLHICRWEKYLRIQPRALKNTDKVFDVWHSLFFLSESCSLRYACQISIHFIYNISILINKGHVQIYNHVNMRGHFRSLRINKEVVWPVNWSFYCHLTSVVHLYLWPQDRKNNVPQDSVYKVSSKKVLLCF